MLTVEQAFSQDAIWCQQQWIERHYLHSKIDPRCRPIAYIVLVDGERRGALGFGRPESTRCNGWYGSVEDVQVGRARLTRWEIINLARVWLDPRIQPGGGEEIHNAATQAIAQALKRTARIANARASTDSSGIRSRRARTISPSAPDAAGTICRLSIA